MLSSVPTYPSYSVNVATVEVDPGTGQVRLLDLVAGQDVGRALNPLLVEGQMQGGAIQSIGFGLMEGYRYDEKGGMLNPNLLDYAIPTALDVPNIRTVMVEDPCEHGPYGGGRAWGEPPIIPGWRGGGQRDLRRGGRQGPGVAHDAGAGGGRRCTKLEKEVKVVNRFELFRA